MQAKVNQVLFIQVDSLDEEEAKQNYKSRIADIKDDYFAIEIPMHEKDGSLKRLYAGDHLSVYYVTEGGTKNYFHTNVVSMTEDNIKQYLIQKPDPDSITKVQRRNYLRVPAELEIAVKHTKNIPFVALTEDMSGGGLSFICDGKFSLHAKDEISCWILIHFKNDTIDHVFFKGELLRVKELETGKQLVMVSFTDIKSLERQKIIKFCFERQFELRK